MIQHQDAINASFLQSSLCLMREISVVNTGLLAIPEDYTIEGPATESAVLELLMAGKVEELRELNLNWTTKSE